MVRRLGERLKVPGIGTKITSPDTLESELFEAHAKSASGLDGDATTGK